MFELARKSLLSNSVIFSFREIGNVFQIERMIKSVIPCLHGENFNESANAVY